MRDLLGQEVTALEFSLELSSEVPGTSRRTGLRTSRFRDQRSGHSRSMDQFLAIIGDQARRLYSRLVEAEGQPVRKVEELARRRTRGPSSTAIKISPVSLRDLGLAEHHSIRLKNRGQGRSAPSRRHQHIRARLRQLRPGHHHAIDDRAQLSERARLHNTAPSAPKRWAWAVVESQPDAVAPKIGHRDFRPPSDDDMTSGGFDIG